MISIVISMLNKFIQFIFKIYWFLFPLWTYYIDEYIKYFNFINYGIKSKYISQILYGIIILIFIKILMNIRAKSKIDIKITN